jgi:hypothetical protein
MDCKDSKLTERRNEYEFHMEEAKFLMPSPAIAPKEKGVHMDTSILHPPPLLAGEEELKLGKPTKC